MSVLDTPPLDHVDRQILAVLKEGSGFCTADVARHAGLSAGRKHSAILSRRIRYLEMHGLVCRLDDITPIAWVRTRAGTAVATPTTRSPLPLEEGR